MTSPEPQRQQAQQPIPPQTETKAEETRAPEAQGSTEHRGGKVMHLHTAHPQVPIPYVTPGDMFSGARKAMSTGVSTATSLLPSPRKLAFYGILGGMTAAGAMAWPVAVAVGAATEVITREQAAQRRAEQQPAGRERTKSEQDRPSSADWTPAGTPGQTAMS
ncbi:hypothetical protein [Streptomyces bicolor]|uniref:hypothetical protein n=1 Tax=Streptomyces bicolor TaxID=66874 RepID=UPI000A6EA69A|nr:hypothetical protein [Streptomyces bicolor]